MNSIPFWFAWTALFILAEGFFAMQEMAILSYNRLALNYRLERGERRARWIGYFLNHPHRLFTTILLANDACLHVGSECSRRLYQSLGWSASIAPLTQIILVILLAELAPMFAARRNPEAAAHIGAGLLYGLSQLLLPLTWFIGKLSDLASFCLGIPAEGTQRLLAREDVHTLLFPAELGEGGKGPKPLADIAIANLLSQRGQDIEGMMCPLRDLIMLRSDTEMRVAEQRWIAEGGDGVLIYQRSRQHIIGALTHREFLTAQPYQTAAECAQLPFFTSSQTNSLELVSQLRQNGRDFAIALNANGMAVGYVTLVELQAYAVLGKEPKTHPTSTKVLEKRFDSQVTVEELMRTYDVTLPMHSPRQTLAELLEFRLGHLPQRGDVCRINELEFVVESDGIASAKSVLVRSLIC